MDNGLRTCPYCGLGAILKTNKDRLKGDTYTATCRDTSCIGRNYKKYVTAKAAADAWNRRAEK